MRIIVVVDKRRVEHVVAKIEDVANKGRSKLLMLGSKKREK